MATNKGVVITGSRNLDAFVDVRPTPYPKLEDDKIIIRSVAHGVNPTDWKHIFTEDFLAKIVSDVFKYPGFGIGLIETPLGFIGSTIGYYLGKCLTFLVQKGKVVGSDVSGIVEEVGRNVTNVKKGDIVSASLHGATSKNGGFAEYVAVRAIDVIKYHPSQILNAPLDAGNHPGKIIDSFEAAASITLGLKTVGLSLHHNLGIPLNKTQNANDYLLIWGGATATGILAIQVAKLVYGINVITTASKRNHALLRELGADEVLDYNDADVVDQIKRVGQNRIKYAFDCVSSTQTLQSVYDATAGTDQVAIDNLLFLTENAITTDNTRKVKFTWTNVYMLDLETYMGTKPSPKMLLDFREFWDLYLTAIIENIKTAPLKVLPAGFESAMEGLRLLHQNKVSGQKVVFRSKL